MLRQNHDLLSIVLALICTPIVGAIAIEIEAKLRYLRRIKAMRS
jgi:hypothetical protein